MYKILVSELVPAKGHADLFQLVSQILSKNENISVDILTPLGSNIAVSNCSCYEMPYSYHENPWSQKRLMDLFYRIKYELKISRYVGKFAKHKDYSALFVVTYSEQSLPLGIKFLASFKHIFVVHNNNIDTITKRIYRRCFFYMFSNNVHHVVLADFIKRFLVNKLNIRETNVLTLPTPYSPLINSINEIKDIDCLGISNGNDESFIAHLIEEERKTNVFKKKGLHVVLKSKSHCYDDDYLSIIKGFIPRKQYDNYVARAKVMLIPFPITYKYRMSGTFVDALSHKIPVIATPIMMIKEAMKAYPSVVHILNEQTFIDDVAKIMAQNKERETIEFEKFRSIHSVEYLSKYFTNSFISILEGGKSETNRYDF